MRERGLSETKRLTSRHGRKIGREAEWLIQIEPDHVRTIPAGPSSRSWPDPTRSPIGAHPPVSIRRSGPATPLLGPFCVGSPFCLYFLVAFFVITLFDHNHPSAVTTSTAHHGPGPTPPDRGSGRIRPSRCADRACQHFVGSGLVAGHKKRKRECPARHL